MSSSPSNFIVDDFMNAVETMNSTHDTIESKLNIYTSSFTDYKILNSHPIQSDINNELLKTEDYDEKKFLEKIDTVINEFGTYYNKYDIKNNLSYILDINNLKDIIHDNKKNTTNTTTNCKFVGSKIKNILHEHNYCMTKETSQPCEETLDIPKLEDFYETKQKSFNNDDDFTGVCYNIELDEPYKFGDTEINFPYLNLEIITDQFSSDNISICAISDDEHIIHNIGVPDLDVISINSDIEDNMDVINESKSHSSYHSSDFEFIEEHETIKEGLIIKHNSHTMNINKVKNIEISKETNSHENILDYNVPASNNNIEHEIPQDIDYIDMFERNVPYPMDCMENKSIYTNNCTMHVEYQELGFHKRLIGRENVEKYVRDEANESKNKIISMYPSENRRIRKRRRI